MIIDNDPPIERHISVPRDMSQLSSSSFTAGIVEAVLDGLGFVCLSMHDILAIVHIRSACPCDCTQYTYHSISFTDNNFDQTGEIGTGTRGAAETMKLSLPVPFDYFVTGLKYWVGQVVI